MKKVDKGMKEHEDQKDQRDFQDHPLRLELKVDLVKMVKKVLPDFLVSKVTEVFPDVMAMPVDRVTGAKRAKKVPSVPRVKRGPMEETNLVRKVNVANREMLVHQVYLEAKVSKVNRDFLADQEKMAEKVNGETMVKMAKMVNVGKMVKMPNVNEVSLEQLDHPDFRAKTACLVKMVLQEIPERTVNGVLRVLWAFVDQLAIVVKRVKLEIADLMAAPVRTDMTGDEEILVPKVPLERMVKMV